MIAKATKEIDGITFEVSGLDLRTERSVLIRLTKLVGPAITELAGGDKDSKTRAMRALFDGLDEESFDYLIETFKKVTKVQMEVGKEDAKTTTAVPYMESAFKNGVSSQLQWLWFCLEHQFGGFLDSGSGKPSGILAALLAKTQQAVSS